MTRKRVILVTGASGFVGRALVQRLSGQCRLILVDRAFDEGAEGTDIVRLPGDFGDLELLDAAFAEPVDAVVALASLPGGAAEADPALSRRVNIDAMLDLLGRAADSGTTPYFLFASSIAVFGDRMPPLVDDATSAAPTTVYGVHKAMMELAVADAIRRGRVRGCALRLPGIVARPRGRSGMKTAFLSDAVHAVIRGEDYAMPVSPDATTWLMSLPRLIDNLVYALDVVSTDAALTLPAMRVRIDAYVAALGRAAGMRPAIHYKVDDSIERGFGRQSPLVTRAAEQWGFASDGSIDELAARAVAVARGDLAAGTRHAQAAT